MEAQERPTERSIMAALERYLMRMGVSVANVALGGSVESFSAEASFRAAIERERRRGSSQAAANR